MKRAKLQAAMADAARRLDEAERKLAWPVAPPPRRPTAHVLYGGAHLFREDTLEKMGKLARRSFETYAPDARAFADALAIETSVAQLVFERVAMKLATRPVEDFRIDFEDGYGPRSDEEEDGHARDAARALSLLEQSGPLVSAVGIRVKSLAGATRARAFRTLELFFSALMERGDRVPDDFVVTLPKVRAAAEVAAFVDVLAALEASLGLREESIAIELMIETPEALFERSGACALPGLFVASRGRCVAMHVGSYDLTASVGVAAHEQRLDHPVCDLAKELMQLSLAGSGVQVSDGATTILPIEPHRPARAGDVLDPAVFEENRRAVTSAWRLHADNVRHGLRGGITLGWDLHPAQIPARFGALYAFFLRALPAMRARLDAFRAEEARATRVGQVFDDRATAEGLANFFRAGRACGALSEADVEGIAV